MRLTDRTVAVTGATGFLGSHIALALRDAGAHVRAVVRRPERGAWLEELGIELVQADLLQPDALTAAFLEADAVVANAALGSSQGDLDAFERVNQQGTQNTLDATSDAGVTRLIHISTVAVYRTRLYTALAEDAEQTVTDRRRFTWSDLTTDWRYARTKTRAEQLVWKHADQTGLATTALRPGPVYGSRDPKLTARYLAGLERRFAVAPTVGVPQVHAGDVAQAVVGALANDDSAGQAYNLAGPPTSPYETMRTLRRLAGRGPRVLLPLPLPIWVQFDTTAAQRDLGFTARSLQEGLAEVLSPTPRRRP
jgi:nucleoside-diphosphate-sugar epimerase